MDSIKIVSDSILSKWDSIPKLLSSGAQYLDCINKNTNQNFVDDGLNLLAVISIIIAAVALIIETVTWFGITGTKQSIIDEAEKNRVDKECQYRLFQDIIRHLYRNRVCTITMEIKMKVLAEQNHEKQNTYKKYYPSEEHILKLKLLPSDIHLEEYYRDANTYQRLHEMELQLRNYNTEIDSAYIHLPSTSVPDETKIRDFDTLNFKTSFLTDKLIALMNVMWPEKDNMYEVQNLIYASQQNNYKNNKDFFEENRKKYQKDIIDRLQSEKMNKDIYVTKIFRSTAAREIFINGLETDLLIECGTNSRNEEKIHIIKRVDDK